LYPVMRRALLALCALALLVSPAYAAKPPDKGKPPNEDKPPKGPKNRSVAVEHLATLPAPAGVSANFKRYPDGKTYMFVSTLGGLVVYDVTNGAAPIPAATMPLPHFQNEDVSLGGNRLLISTDGGVGGGFLFEIDISDPTLPQPVRAIKLEPVGEGHTASCIDPACRWVWVAGDQLTPGIDVFDLDKAAQVDAGAVKVDNDPGLWTFGFIPIPAAEVSVGSIDRGADENNLREFGWSTHDVHVDEAGVAWVAGGDGTIGFDVSKYGAHNMLNPPVVARTGEAALNDGDAFDGPLFGNMEGFDPEKNEDTVNDFVHHNALRPDAGDTVLITEEDLYNRRVSNMPGGCEVQGSFQTWRIEGGDLTPLDTWTTEFNELLADTDQDPWGGDVVPTMGLCSAHYFDERDGLVAIAWYEQGVRLLDVEDPTNIEQVGYWLPPGLATWSTYWSPTAKDILYVVDNKRGVDVLRVRRGKTAPAEAPILPSWTAGEKSFGKAYPGLSWICRVR
jgi:hypothetical protein